MASDEMSLHAYGMNDGTNSPEDSADRLALLREWAGFDNQSAFARRTGLNPSEWNHMESGRRALSMTVAAKLRLQWRVTLDWLYYGDRAGLSMEVSNSLPRLDAWRAGRGGNKGPTRTAQGTADKPVRR